MKKILFLVSLIGLLALAACSATPAPGQPTVEAQAVAATSTTAPAQPTATPAPVAPLVVSSAPERGAEQPLDAAVVITFDQPMDRASVEKAFAIEPGASVDGKFDWTDNDRTVSFTPKKGFERGQRYKVRVVETAKSQTGLAMLRPFELRFSAVGFLEVATVQPAADTEEVALTSTVTVMFNRPVAPLTAIEAMAGLPDPLTFTPPVKGQGQWLNTSIYQFTPAGGFEPATQYTARVAKGLADAAGNAALTDDFEWKFTTVAPAVLASIPAGGDVFVSPSPVISVTFNQLMDHASVEKNLRLVNQTTSEVISGTVKWVNEGVIPPASDDNSDSSYDYTYSEGSGPAKVGVETIEFTPKKALEFDTVYQIELPAGVAGKAGHTATNRDYSAAFTVVPLPAVESTYPANGDTGVETWQSLQITFNSPMNPDSVIVGKNLTIRPTVAATQVYTYWSNNNTSLEINMPTEASSKYAVTLGADATGRYGQKLGKSTRVAWETKAEAPQVYLHSPGRIATYNAYSDTVAYVSVRNVGQVNFSLYRLSQADFIHLNGNNWWEEWDAYRPAKSDLLAEWELPVTPELNSNLIYKVDIGKQSKLGNPLPPGLYYLQAEAPADQIYPEAQDDSTNLQPERQMLVVSNRNLTFKSSNAEGLAWLTDLRSGQPLKNVPVTFISGEDEGQSKTDADGVATYTYKTGSPDANVTQFAFAGDPARPTADFAVAVSDWSDGIERYSFNNVSVEDYQQPYNAHVYTDRKIYRPGQTVYFKGILRADNDAQYSLPTASNTVQLNVSDSQGKNILSTELPLSRNGTITGEIQLDDNAALGSYSMEMIYSDTTHSPYTFYGDFQVASYRKPEFVVTAQTDKPEYVNGDKVRVSAQANFYFGGPVSNAAVKWTLTTGDYAFNYTGNGFYDFTDYDTSRDSFYYSSFGETLAEGDGKTDGDGRFTFEVDADIAEKIASQQFTFDVTVTDLNNQEVAAQATAVVHKGLFYVGLRPEEYVGTAGKASTVNALVVDWQSQPVANQEVELVFAEHNWYSVQKQYDDGSFYWDSVAETVPVFTTTVTSNAQGQANASFTPKNGGIYKVMAHAVDSRRNDVRSSTFMWISGEEYVNWRQENNDRIELVADKHEYNVGDTATVLVPHPYSGTVTALVTLERGHIYRHFVKKLLTNSEQLQIPITEDMIPNMYVSVVVMQGVDKNNPLPSFKVGYAGLPINVKEKELTITLTPNKPAAETYQPGETAEYKVQVTDAHSQPVKAELSLALVDKAVLALAPETPGQLMSTFWHNRGLGVRTGGGLALAIDRINLAISPEAKGGGGGFDQGYGPIRGDFRDTALWIADFETNDAGEGVVTTTLPDNLTTWTLTGKAVTGADTRVGEGRVEIVSAKPLLVRSVAPRFFVVGDEAQLGVIVQNNSQAAQTATVQLQAEGLTVGNWRIGKSANGAGQVGQWQSSGAPEVTLKPGDRVKVEWQVTVPDGESVKLTMGAKSADYGDALTFELPVYRFSTPETVSTVGILDEDGTRTEAISLPRNYDKTQGELAVHVDPSLAAGMRDGLKYLEHYRYECTEQTVSRFLPNVFTYRAYQQLKMQRPDLEEKLPGQVSIGLQRLYNQQHVDGGWGWFIHDDSQPSLTAYVLLGLVEAQRAGFTVDETVISNTVSYLQGTLTAPKDIQASWEANRQAFILYALAEAGQGDMGRSVALFNARDKLDTFGRAYLAMAIYKLDDQARQIKTLLDDITSAAIVSAGSAHWEEAQVDYYAMNTDTRSTAIIVAALSRIQPDHPLLPQAVRWLMSIRENGGHWETTQETAWAIIGLTDYLVATGELNGEYNWRVSLNGSELGNGAVSAKNIDETTQLRAGIASLLTAEVNRLVVERDPAGSGVSGSPGRLYYAAYLTTYQPANQVKAQDRGIVISRQYSLADDPTNKAISSAKVGDVINVELTLVAPDDLNYVLVEDAFPAGAEGIDTSLATTSVVGQEPSLERTDRRDPWGYGWWWFSHAELRDEKAVLFATYLPKGTYVYRYQIRASLPGQFNVIPTHAEEMYFPEVFGRSDGGLFKIEP